MPLLQCRDDIRFCIGIFCVRILSRNSDRKFSGLCFIASVLIGYFIKSFNSLCLQRFVNFTISADDLLIVCIKLYAISIRYVRHRNLCRICCNGRSSHRICNFGSLCPVIRKISFIYLQFINRYSIPGNSAICRLNLGDIQSQEFSGNSSIQCNLICCRCRCLCCSIDISPVLTII